MDHDVRPIINDVMETIIINIECKKTVTINENYNTIFIIEPIDDKEYYSDKTTIWWKNTDYFHFRIVAKYEILNFIRNYKKDSNLDLSVKDAILMLYQP
jgi:hypothetical protein